MGKFEDSKAAFTQYKENINVYLAEDITEADTRSKILDELFIKILGWSENDIRREGHTKKGYFDYKFSVPNFRFIVEAKKNMERFELPKNYSTLTLKTLDRKCENVINQIRKYLGEVGLQYGVISNGTQFIVAKFFNSDGIDWQKNKCIIFDGLDKIENEFALFYNLFSKEAVIENSGFQIDTDEDIPHFILSGNASKNEELIRNNLSSNLIPVIDKAFGEIYKYETLDDKEMLKKCFIENTEIKKNKSELEKLFADSPPKLNEIIPARNTSSIANQIKEEIDSDEITIKEKDPPKPIIIVGTKGAGKTTFIHYMFQLMFSKEFLKSRPFIYIDFRKYISEDINNINEFVLKDAMEDLFERYEALQLHSLKVLKRIYLKEIKRNNESIWKYDKESNIDRYNEKLSDYLNEQVKNINTHFKKLSEYLIRERSMRLCLIIDNVDQFDFDTQKKVFLFAQSINMKSKCFVLITLREGFYYKWRNKPPFDAYSSNVYHITAPKYSEVLQKRIEYALQKVPVKGSTSGQYGENVTVRVENSKVKEFLSSIRSSLFGSGNYDILEFLEGMTYPNIREGLEIFRRFLLSGHTEVSEFIVRYTVPGNTKSVIPKWEFIKAVALDNKKYYSHDISVITNIFYPTRNSNFHFLKIKILKYLFKQIEDLGSKEKFVNIQTLIDIFSEAGFKRSIVKNELKELHDSRLIETDTSLSDQDEDIILDSQNISITLKGSYYINTLLKTFVYYDLVLQDTPIFNQDSFKEILKKFPYCDDEGKRNLAQRVRSSLSFVHYLRSQERLEYVENPNIPKDIITNYFKDGLSTDFLKAKNAINKYESKFY